MMQVKNKRAQEEIVGFAVIVIIVSIILIFFLVFSLSDKPKTESYETESFLQASLHYTSSCTGNGRYLPVQDLIFSCYKAERCDNEEEACVVLNQTLKGILKESWQVGEDFPAKGYKLEIFSEEEAILSLIEGNVTGSYKGAQQSLPKGVPVRVLFSLYYQ
ncbi:MAG: hypothetical protein AABW93_03845 [Nanoarchaeota archaeon]